MLHLALHIKHIYGKFFHLMRYVYLFEISKYIQLKENIVCLYIPYS